jgi:hypothetical protein
VRFRKQVLRYPSRALEGSCQVVEGSCGDPHKKRGRGRRPRPEWE